MKYRVDFTEPQRQALFGFIDQGIRSGGLNAAADGLVLATILQNAEVILEAGEKAPPQDPPQTSGTTAAKPNTSKAKAKGRGR